MTSSSLVSICLPLYNGAKHLVSAIESVRAQTFESFELLIADDGSTDGSDQIAMDYARNDQRIRYWKNEQRQGLFGNYNACIKNARGKYIKPFAQDDVLSVECIQKMFTVLEENDSVALVSSARKIIDTNGEQIELKQPFSSDMCLPGKDVIRFNLIALNNWVGEPSTVMFRAQDAGTGFDTMYYHYGDIEYWFRILTKGDLQYFESPLASFRRHGENQTDKNHRELLIALDVLRLSLSYRDILAEFEPEELFKRRLIEKLALEHGHVVASTGASELLKEYSAAFLSADGEAQNTASTAELKVQAEGFRLLTSMALATVSELISELDHEKRCRKDEHDRFVVEVDKMRNSLYWKLSSPVRRMLTAIKPEPKDS